MTTIRATFDGKVFVPDEPVDLPVGEAVSVRLPGVIEEDDSVPPDHPHRGLIELARQAADNPDSPGDLAAQVDHYLYGSPKRE